MELNYKLEKIILPLLVIIYSILSYVNISPTLIFLFSLFSLLLSKFQSKYFLAFLFVPILCQNTIAVDGSNVSSIYFLSIFGLSSPVILLTLGFLKSLNLRKFDLLKEVLSNDLKVLIVLGFILSIFFGNLKFFRIIIHDLSYVIVPFLIFSTLKKNKYFSIDYLELLIWILTLDFFLEYFLKFKGYGINISGEIFPYISANRNIVNILITYPLWKYLNGKFKNVYIILIIIGTYVTISFASRTSVFFLLFQILLFFMFGGKTVRKKLLNPYIIVLFLIPIFVVTRNMNLDHFLWKITTFESSLDTDFGDGSDSSLVRFYETLNIYETIKDYPLGKGLGGYFTDQYYPYAKNLLGKNSYKDEWIFDNTLFKPHSFVLFVFLKFGIPGLILLLKWLKELFVRLKRSHNDDIIYILTFLPFLLYKSFNTQLMVWFAIFYSLSKLKYLKK